MWPEGHLPQNNLLNTDSQPLPQPIESNLQIGKTPWVFLEPVPLRLNTQPEGQEAGPSSPNYYPPGRFVGTGCPEDGVSGVHLGLGEHERGGHLKTLGPGQVLVELELVLQLQQLLAGESRARPSALPQEVRLRLRCGPKGESLCRSVHCPGSSHYCPCPSQGPASSAHPQDVGFFFNVSVSSPRTRGATSQTPSRIGGLVSIDNLFII